MDYLGVMFWSPYTSVVTAVVVAVSILIFLGVQFDRQQQRKSTIGIEDEVDFD